MDRLPVQGLVALAIGVSAWVSVGSAQARGLGERLSFEAAEGCPSREVLLREIEARLPPGEAPEADETRSEVSVRIEKDSRGFVGVLLVAGENPRRLEGDECAEVLRALGIVIASQIVRERAQSQMQLSAAESSTNSPPDAESEMAAPAPGPEPRGPARRLAEPRREPVTRAEPQPRQAKRIWSLGSGGTVLVGVAPKVAWGPLVGAELVFARPIATSLRVAVERVFTGTFGALPARASFNLTAVRASGCLLAWSDQRTRLSGCVEAAYGTLEATGVAAGPIVDTRTVREPWVSVGPSLRIQTNPWANLDVAFEAALPVPLWHEELIFQVPPNTTVHKTNSVTGRIALLLEVRWGGSIGQVRGIAR